MAQTIKAPNFSSVNIVQRLVVSDSVVAGSPTINLVSTENLAVGDLLYVPQAPNQTAEKLSVQLVGPHQVALNSNLVYDHLANDIVTKVFGDQLKFYSVLVPANGTVPDDSLFVAIPGALVNIDPQVLETEYTDNLGGQSYWYKFTYYNSFNNAETALSLCPAIRGGNYGHYTTLDAIRLEAGFQNNPSIEDAIIDGYRRLAEGEVNGFLATAYTLPFASVPALVEYATIKLAAGYLMCKEYGPYQEGESKEGLGKISEARALLKRIAERTTVLADALDNIITENQVIDGWPNDTTKNLPKSQGGGDFMFDTNTRY